MQRWDFKGIFSIRTWKVLRSQCKETWKPLAGSPVSQPPSHTTAAKSYANTLSSSLSQLVKIEINTNPPDSTNITISTSVWVKQQWHGTKQGRVEVVLLTVVWFPPVTRAVVLFVQDASVDVSWGTQARAETLCQCNGCFCSTSRD